MAGVHLPLLILVLVVATAMAGEGFSLARLQEASRQVQSLRVPFVQEKHLAILDQPVRSTGVIEISRTEHAVRWEFTGKSLLVFREGRMRRWGPDGREESLGQRDPGLRVLGEQMEGLLSGDFSSLERAFVVVPAEDGSPALAITPRSADLGRFIAAIGIRFRDDLTAPAAIELSAAAGDRTLYRFGEPELGVPIPAARFAGP